MLTASEVSFNWSTAYTKGPASHVLSVQRRFDESWLLDGARIIARTASARVCMYGFLKIHGQQLLDSRPS